MKRRFALAALLALAACATPAPQAPQDAFFVNLSRLCGQSFAGQLVTTDARDADMTSQALVMHVRDCNAREIRIPFNVGENRSRTWVITRTDSGIRLKHDHRHEDGSVDVLTQYGGDTAAPGTDARQEFPADGHSRELFAANNIPASAENVWAVEVNERTFAYELRRPNRHFRVEFDLSAPVSTPPPSWGASGAAH